MTTKTYYVANDGVEFTEADKCIDYEQLIYEVSLLMNELNPIPDTISFLNGEGYIQQSYESFHNVKRQLLFITKRYITHKWVEQSISNPNVHLSFVYRLIGETNLKVLERAWNRMTCIDKEYREWGQMGYAENPKQATNIQLNKQPTK